MEKRIALIGILVEDLDQSSHVNELLHEYGHHITARMGVPHRERGVSVISVVIDASNDVISALAGKLGKIKDVQVKTLYMKEK